MNEEEINKEMLKAYLKVFKAYKDCATNRDKVLSGLFGRDHFDGLLGEQFGALEDMILTLMSDATNCSTEELNWFVYEADMGDDPKECELVDGTEILVDSIDTFLETI